MSERPKINATDVSAAGSIFNPAAAIRAVGEAGAFLWNARRLIAVMAARDLSSRYAGQILGVFWAIGHPLFQMAVYLFVFGVVFRQSIGGTEAMPRDYTVYILSGLVAWLSIVPILAGSAISITQNANLIKQFAFDARVLPAKEIFSGAIVWAVGVTILAGYTAVVYGTIPATYALIPVLAIMHFAIALGLAWAIGAIAAYLRDVKDIVTLATTVMIYVLPIVYLPDWIPAALRVALYANPFSYLIWCYQDVFYFGRIDNPVAWLVCAIFAPVVLATGYRLFARLQPNFGNVL